MSHINGIWCGKDATVAIIDDFRIAFLRIKNDLIASVFHHNNFGTIGVVYGMGVNFNSSAEYCGKNPQTGLYFCKSLEGKQHLQNHSDDKIELDAKADKLIYTMFDGRVFELFSAEKIEMQDFYRTYPVDNTVPLEQRMAKWGVGYFFDFSDSFINAGIDTEKYSVLFYFSVNEKRVYCRVGQNGYCKKGRAMLSTTCIRQNECRMIEDNLLTINDYIPVEEYFAEDSCAFPADGGWYWSVKEVTDDEISLYGCGGAIYKICRKK